jgi:hypothetical protein
LMSRTAVSREPKAVSKKTNMSASLKDVRLGVLSPCSVPAQLAAPYQ